MRLGTRHKVSPSGLPIVGFWRRIAGLWLDVWLIAGATFLLSIPLFARLSQQAQDSVHQVFLDVENWLRVVYRCIVTRTAPPEGFITSLPEILKRDLDLSNAVASTLLWLVFFFSIMVTYVHVIRVARKGRSLADSVLGTYKVDAHGEFLSLRRASLRVLLFITTYFLVNYLDASTNSTLMTLGSLVTAVVLVNYLWPLWDDQGQTLLDKAVGSYAVHPDRFGSALQAKRLK